VEEHGQGGSELDELEALPSFPCSGCGSCCMDVKHIPELAQYAGPKGRCTMLGPDDKTCTIYADRPLVCRVDDMGKLIRLTPRSWRTLNRNACQLLHVQVHHAPLEPIGEECRHGHPKATVPQPLPFVPLRDR
jgi:uncharacterized protein